MNRNILGWGWVGEEEHSQSQITLIENKNEEVIDLEECKPENAKFEYH